MECSSITAGSVERLLQRLFCQLWSAHWLQASLARQTGMVKSWWWQMRRIQGEAHIWIANLDADQTHIHISRDTTQGCLTSPKASCSEYEDGKLKETTQTQFRIGNIIQSETLIRFNCKEGLEPNKRLAISQQSQNASDQRVVRHLDIQSWKSTYEIRY